MSDRTDKGALWENFVINEFMKQNLNIDKIAKYYFWRTTRQQKIDFIMDSENSISAFEIKWNTNKKVKIPKPFVDNYPNVKVNIITPDNFLEFILS